MYGKIRNLGRRIPKQRKEKIFYEIEEIIANYERKINEDTRGKAYIPANIEFQIKTAKVAKNANSGAASHYEYKGENPEDIKKKYKDDPDSFILGTTIPIMWRSGIDENGRRIIKLLTREEVAEIVHPYIKERD